MLFSQAWCFLLWNSPREHIDILARCNLLSLLQRRANKISCLCAKHFRRNANAAAQSPVWAAHSWWGLICVCARCSMAGAYTPPQRKCSLCTPSRPERQYMVKVMAHDSFIFFFPTNVLTPLFASGGLNYLSYIRKEMLRDTRTFKMERELRVRHTNTPTTVHVNVRHHSKHTHTCMRVYINTLNTLINKHTQCHRLHARR